MSNQDRMSIPPSSGAVAKRFLKKEYQTGPTVEEARAAMLSAAEPATTTGGGTKVPKFIQERRGPGGNTPVAVEEHEESFVVHAPQNDIPAPVRPQTKEQERAEQAALRHSGKRKLTAAGFRNGETVDLIQAIKDGVVEKAEAEALTGREIVVAAPATETAEEVLVVEPPKTVEPVLSDAVKPEFGEDSGERERIETKNFVAEIYKDGKNWVAEITYKNGSGSEIFKAPTLKALSLKMAEGKGHGTVKVRETVQRYKLGNEYNTWDDFFKEILADQGVTIEDFNALPQGSKDVVYDNYQTVHIQKFLAEYPEYYPTQDNWKRISSILKKKDIPVSTHNLELIYRELMDDELLDVRPVTKIEAPAPVAAAPVPVVPAVTAVEDSAPVVPAPAAATPQSAPRKRGLTGLIPGQSSATPSAVAATEDGTKSRELSRKEALEMAKTPEGLKELRRRAIPSLNRQPSR